MSTELGTSTRKNGFTAFFELIDFSVLVFMPPERLVLAVRGTQGFILVDICSDGLNQFRNSNLVEKKSAVSFSSTKCQLIIS